MKYDATGKTEEEVTKEAVRLSDAYETVEVERKDGKIMIFCKGKVGQKTRFKIGRCRICRYVGRVQRMDSGYQLCKTCWFAVTNELWKVVKARDAKPRNGVAG